jgi:hypothetical protein
VSQVASVNLREVTLTSTRIDQYEATGLRHGHHRRAKLPQEDGTSTESQQSIEVRDDADVNRRLQSVGSQVSMLVSRQGCAVDKTDVQGGWQLAPDYVDVPVCAVRGYRMKEDVTARQKWLNKILVHRVNPAELTDGPKG